MLYVPYVYGADHNSGFLSQALNDAYNSHGCVYIDTLCPRETKQWLTHRKTQQHKKYQLHLAITAVTRLLQSAILC